MLNTELNLNSNFFTDDVEIAPTRKGYGTGLVELGEKDPNVVVLSADLTESTQSHLFAEKFPERSIQVGVAEQNMAAIAAGLGVSGKTAFISSYATFSPGKNWETIRTTIVYNNSNVKVAGHHSGTMTGPDGATHQATEDIASVRAWPGIKIVVPCDSNQAHLATLEAGSQYGPFYLRFSRDKSPVVTTKETPFELGKGQVFYRTDNPQAVIFATGFIVTEALYAAKMLEESGIQTDVVNIHTIKPLDKELILDYASKTGAIVTVEDHQVSGGLGGAVAELLAQNRPTPMEIVGVPDVFGESGKPYELLEKFGMDKNGISDAVRRVISRK